MKFNPYNHNQVVAALSKPGDGIAATRLLVSCGGDVNRSDFLGRTPLHYATINGNTALVMVLLEYEANINCYFQQTSINTVLMERKNEKWMLLLKQVRII